MTDLLLAIAHHVAVFSLVMMLALEAGLLKAETLDVVRLGRLDAGYGLASVLVIAVGVARVIFGAKGWDFYAGNPWFWGKMGAFLLVGLASIPPSIRMGRWRKQAAGGANVQPPAAELAAVRLWVRGELVLIFAIVACAAAMARWPV